MNFRSNLMFFDEWLSRTPGAAHPRYFAEGDGGSTLKPAGVVTGSARACSYSFIRLSWVDDGRLAPSPAAPVLRGGGRWRPQAGGRGHGERSRLQLSFDSVGLMMVDSRPHQPHRTKTVPIQLLLYAKKRGGGQPVLASD